jgi:predicted lipoprotein with Yx(FWY)xxD motif
MNTKRLTASVLAVVAAGVAVLAIAVSGGSASKTKGTLKPTALSGAGTLTVKRTALGSILVDGKGRTLYLFEADKPNRSTLSRAGLEVWPAFTSVTRPRVGSGVSAAHVASVKQADGLRQVTYYGHPLYYFVGDKGAGETNGQGLKEFGALWYVLSSQGVAITETNSTTAPATESPSYSY